MRHNHKHVIVHAIILFLIISGLGYYHNYTTKLLRHDFSNQLGILQQALVTSTNNYNLKLAELNNNMNNNIETLNSAIGSQNILFKNMINSLKQENQQKDQQIIQLIENIEEQNKAKLDELKEDLQSDIKNIQLSGSDFSGIVDKVVKSVVSVLTDKGQGSGAFITNDGHIITNNHVIASAMAIKILTSDNLLYNAELVGRDVASDIAVLKINSINYSRLRFEDSSNVKVGEKVIAVGNPGGFDFTVTEGIVSAVNRKASNGQYYIQTDVSINPGNSGGPLLNTAGRIVGINNFKIMGFEGVGFALNPSTANEVSKSIIDQFR